MGVINACKKAGLIVALFRGKKKSKKSASLRNALKKQAFSGQTSHRLLQTLRQEGGQHDLDRVGQEVVDEYIKDLASGIVNIINIFQPTVLAIGGGICNEGDYLLKPLFDRIWKETYTKEGTPRTEVTIAKLGNDAGIIGAAVLGL